MRGSFRVQARSFYRSELARRVLAVRSPKEQQLKSYSFKLPVGWGWGRSAWGPAAFWGGLWRIFRNFLHFGGFLDTSYAILVFFTDFFRFWIDFAWFLEGFGKVFGGPFPRFFTFFAQIAFLCESQQNTAWAHEFSRSTFQKTRKVPKNCQKKAMKLWGWKKQGQNSHKY